MTNGFEVKSDGKIYGYYTREGTVYTFEAKHYSSLPARFGTAFSEGKARKKPHKLPPTLYATLEVNALGVARWRGGG